MYHWIRVSGNGLSPLIETILIGIEVFYLIQAAFGWYNDNSSIIMGAFLFSGGIMKNQLEKKQVLLIGVMLFSLFFGAGNLIFPPFLGQEAGINTPLAMLGFIMSAICFPILGIYVISKTNGLNNLANRVSKNFSFIFTILIYLSIGPLLGIPRAGSLPYEMVLSPFISTDYISHSTALFIFTSIFFAFAYWLSKNPSKLIDRLGKILTPTLLTLIFIVFIGSFFKGFKGFGPASGKYIDNSLISGFLDGYQTMDTIAALNFGLVISTVIKDMGIKDNKSILKITSKAGLIAGSFLLIIYSALAYLGALSGGLYGSTLNGAQTLTNISFHIFGQDGLILLATIFTLACLTTAVGLITSISQYFATISKIKYKHWVIIFVLWSLVISNFGLTKILSISVPILNAIYPLALVLIVLALIDDLFIKDSKVYKYTIIITAFISALKFIDDSKLFPQNFSTLLNSIPFFSVDMAWIIPVLFIIIGVLISERFKHQIIKR